MHKLKVTLKQHTPLIHFQHDQEGATLRASEVKPKLDKYIFANAIDDSFEDCKRFLMGYSEQNEDIIKRKYETEGFRALNYKVSFSLKEKISISLNPRYDNIKRKYITDDFPLILSNMGGKDSMEELADFSFYKNIEMTIQSTNDELIEILKDWIDLFFASRNFGQRQDKGFGSFSVININGENKIFPNGDLPEDTRYLKFSFNQNANELDKQKRLFQVIDFYWKCLKSGVNYTRNDQYPNRYIKAFLWTYLNNKGKTWEKKQVKQHFNLTTGNERQENTNTPSFARAILGCPDKFEYKNKNKVVVISHEERNEENKIARIQSPIVFKPVFDGNVVRIYLIINNDSICQLRNENNLRFSFECENNSFSMNIDPNVIDVKELIVQYNNHLNSKVKQSAFENDDSCDEFSLNNNLDNRQWFIPLDFNWRKILQSPSWVEIYKEN